MSPSRLLPLGVALFLAACSSATRPGPPAGPESSRSAPPVRETGWPGAQPDGRVRLPNQWALDPVGRQVALGDFPVNIAVHPGGRYAAILHSGYGPHEIVVVDLGAGRIVSRVELDEAFYGLAFGPEGRQLYASGAGKETVWKLEFDRGLLSGLETIPLRPAKQRGIPAGITVTPDGRRLLVANVFGQSISEVTLAGAGGTARDFHLFPLTADSPGSGATPTPTPTAATNAVAADEDTDAITKRAAALLESLSGDAPFPYTSVVDAVRQRLYVSLWGRASVGVLDLKTGALIGTWPAEAHPNELVLDRGGRRLFVANANRNTVTVFDAETGRPLETLAAELEPGSPPGSTPNSLALAPDDSLLFVANANINAIAVFDISEPGRSRSLGFIPAGWYPTSVRVTPDGRRLLVANGKGLISRPNRNGPQPGREAPASVREHIARMFPGTLSIIDLPARGKFEEQLRQYTARAYACRPPAPMPETTPERGHPVPVRIGEPSPIRYCIYLIKENRTYDQILGDLREGNGDASLCLFPEAVTPNHHQLAREFGLFDNFYVESEVSADGHEWTMGAYATDFVEKMWPMSYGHNKDGKYFYPAEGRFPIAEPAGGYLWDRARAAGVSYRSYGEFVNNGKTPADPGTTRVRALEGHFDPGYRGFDMDYSDLLRADRFLGELRRFEREGDMPRLQIVRLPNDHTAGASAGKLTPTAFVAENDLALGRIVEGVSRSKFWAQTAIFVVEDDAQNGPDHVDAHRTIAYVISPYSRRGHVDSTLYSTASMLRTMELILGLQPMSQFDAAARPMTACFRARADLRPYTALPARVDLQARNTATAWGRELSSRMNFVREDAADDLQLNEIVWRSVRGPDSRMPAPVRAGFVRRAAGGEDDDD